MVVGLRQRYWSLDDNDFNEQSTPELLREKHVNKVKRISSTALAKLGVPMPPGMVLSKSSRWVIPILKDLVVEERRIIVKHHDRINKKALIVLYMMPVILLVIIGVSIWKPGYASLVVGFWFSILHYLCSVIYLWRLKKKEQTLENYRVEIAEFVLKKRKTLPMVAVDSVEADQPANDLINLYCYNATIPLGSILNTLIYCAAVNGTFGILFCGRYLWNAHIFRIFGGAMTVISWICFGRSYYNWRKLPVKCPPV